MATWKGSAIIGAALLWVTSAGAPPTWAQEQKVCPSFKKEIEELPDTDEGNTAEEASFVSSYTSDAAKACLLSSGALYSGGEVVYKITLNEGNRDVAFSLDVQGSADLVLVLIKNCGDGKSCISSSSDFFGNLDEEISGATYTPGIYYLYVDSVQGAGGSYKLTVSGTNPRADLELTLAAPKSVTAGLPFTYTLTVKNKGSGNATGVKITQTLPAGVTMLPGSDCTGTGKTVVCDIGDLAKGSAAPPRSIKVLAAPDARGLLTSTAEATAGGGTTAPPARDEAITPVTSQSDLSLQMTSSADPVVAGEQLTYMFTIHNAGPSDANGVIVEDTLSGKETFAGASGWQCSDTVPVSCGPLKIPVGDTVRGSITVNALSSAMQPLVNRATVRGAEAEPGCKRRRDCGPNSDSVETRVERKTDLTIDLTQDPAGEIALGNVFSYLLKVMNNGPSDSSGAMVVLQDGKGNSVSRPIGPLPSGGHDTVEIPVKTSPDGLEETIPITATVTAKEEDPGPGNSDTLETTLKIQADLSIKSIVDLREVCAGGILEYTVTAVNGGPSNYRGGEISITLSEGLSFLSSPDGCTAGVDAQTVTCTVPPLAAGKNHPVRIAALVADTKPEVSVTGMGGEVTKVRPGLVVSLSAKDLVSLNEPFDYTMTVENRGPSEAKDVKGELELPSGNVQFNLGNIPEGATASHTHSVTPSASGSLTARAFLVNPARCGNMAEATTAVTDLNGVALALTMKADAQAVAVGDLLTYTIQVVNLGDPDASPTVTLTDELPPNTCLETALGCDNSAKIVFSDLKVPTTVTVAVRVLAGAQTPLRNTVSLSPGTIPSATIETPVLPGRLLLPFYEVAESSNEVTTLFALRSLGSPIHKPLAPHETATVNLRDVPLIGTGYVAISPDPPEAPLGGDFVRIDPTLGTASGGLLVPATEMCREWSVRFLNGGPLKTSTDFLFFAPGNGAGAPVATGRVFDEQGQLVQKLTIMETMESFRIGTRDLKLLANFGSIEWTFREGLVGHVAAVHREKDKDEVAVPGHCRRGAVTSALIVPFFQAAPGKTLAAIRNESEDSVTATVNGLSFELAAHETQTLVVAEGAQVDLNPPADVSGDFLLVGPGRARAGGALVRPSQLCRCWDVRFVNGSQMLFYLEGSGTATGKVYEEDGSFRETLTALFPAPSGKGAIEWDLGAKGYAAALFTGSGTEGDYSVLVPGLCRCP